VPTSAGGHQRERAPRCLTLLLACRCDAVAAAAAAAGDADSASSSPPPRTDSTVVVACDLLIKCYGFERPDAHLAQMTNRTHIHSPLWLDPKILLLKVRPVALALALAVVWQQLPLASSGSCQSGVCVCVCRESATRRVK
jgi:hypothetical protein